MKKSFEVTETCRNILVLMKMKNGHVLTFSDKMQIFCFVTCD